jgi:hypothetical protein
MKLTEEEIAIGRAEFESNVVKFGKMPDQSNPHYVGLGQCWDWVGPVMGGYGKLKSLNKTVSIHRFSYLLHKGEIPTDMVVMHRCDNKICANPDHLETGTSIQNIKDAHKRGLCKKRKRFKSSLDFQVLMAASSGKVSEAIHEIFDVLHNLSEESDENRRVLTRFRSTHAWFKLVEAIDANFLYAVHEFAPHLLCQAHICELPAKKNITLKGFKEGWLMDGRKGDTLIYE